MNTKNWTWMPTLQDVALVKISVILWNTDDLRNLACDMSINMCDTDSEPVWSVFEQKAEKLLSKFSLPKSLHEKMWEFFKIIGRQVLRWIHFPLHQTSRLSKEEVPKYFKLTSRGLLNQQKMVNDLLACSRFSLLKRFKIACSYCQEKNIVSLWNELKLIHQDENNPQDVFTNNLSGMVNLWHSILTLPSNQSNSTSEAHWNNVRFSTFQECLKRSALCGNVVAVRHLVQLSPNLKTTLFNHTIHDLANRHQNDTVHVFCYILSLMPTQRQKYIIQRHHKYAFECLLEWPYRKFLLPMTECVWQVLDDQDKFSALKLVWDTLYIDSAHLFLALWLRVPPERRVYASSNFSERFWMTLLDSEDNVKCFLRDATEANRKNIIFSPYGFRICGWLVKEEKFDNLKLFIKECVLYSDIMKEFKEKANEFANSKAYFRQEVWNKFLNFLNEIKVCERKRGDKLPLEPN